MTASNVDEECTLEIPKPTGNKIKLTKKQNFLPRPDLIMRDGNFHQYVGGDGDTTYTTIDIKTISSNGSKVAKDVDETILRLDHKNDFLRKIRCIEFSPYLNCNIIIYESHMISLYKYKQTFNYFPRSLAQYSVFTKMLSGLEFLHNNGYIHGFLNLTSFHIPPMERDSYTVHNVVISDIDLVSRSRKDNFINQVKGPDITSLKTIYEKRLQRNYKNSPFCALKQYTGDKISIKNDIESWYYLCIFISEEIPDWEKVVVNEDKMFIMKNNMRKPTYSGYDKITLRFTEILHFLDKMDDDNVDYNFVKKKLALASRRFELVEYHEYSDSFSKDSDFLKLADISRRRKKVFNQEELDTLLKEIEEEEKKKLNDVVKDKKNKGKNHEKKDKVKKDTEKKVKEDKVSKTTLKDEFTVSETCLPIESENVTCPQKTAHPIETITKNKSVVQVGPEMDVRKKVVQNTENKNVYQEKKTPENNNFLTSVKKKFRKFFKKSHTK